MRLASTLGLVVALFAALHTVPQPGYAAQPSVVQAATAPMPATQPAAAQDSTTTRTFAITEDQINQSYRVTNPASRVVTQRSVDLQPGQIVINETWKLPRQEPVQRTWAFVPTVANGEVTWALVAATRDGQPVAPDVIDQINAQISASWVRFFKEQHGSGHIVSLTISDTEMVYTLEK